MLDVIRGELAAQGRKPRWLAGELGLDPSLISRTLSGGIGLPLDRLVAIEHALGKRRGFLLRAAGLVEDSQTVRESIETDPALSDVYRPVVLAAYDSCVSMTLASRRSSVVRSTSPRTAKKRRS